MKRALNRPTYATLKGRSAMSLYEVALRTGTEIGLL